MKQYDIATSLRWRQNEIFFNQNLIYNSKIQDVYNLSENVYSEMACNYPKFFKMDILSRVAFLATELLNPDLTELDKGKIAVVLSTKSGCLEVDKKFEASRKEIASPALFVYTLPNIMLGEICIKNGFKGEQMCTIEDGFNKEWFDFYVDDLIRNRGMDACLFGHVEATEEEVSVDLFWARTPRI